MEQNGSFTLGAVKRPCMFKPVFVPPWSGCVGESEYIMNVECVIFLGVFAEMCEYVCVGVGTFDWS